MPFPTVADIDRIVALPDPVVRNLWITQTYAELSAAFAGRTGACANWCTFATWASKQAGQTIRAEDLARVVEREMEGAVSFEEAVAAVGVALRALGAERALSDVRGVVRQIIDIEAVAARASDAVARGNLKVFDEIARVFTAFLALPPAAFEDVLGALQEGEPPAGQTLLRRAFAHYADALSADDDTNHTELLVLANLEIGLHEQIRLQPEIAESLDAAVPPAGEVRDRLFARWFPGAQRWLRARLAFWRLVGRPAPLDRALERLVEAARAAVRRAITSHLMTLTLPDRVLRLGVDIGAPHAEPLARPHHPELVALLARVDPRPDDARNSGAIDWADVGERMHFISELFRRFHGAASLHGAPFTAGQVAALRAGRRPDGPL